MSLHVCTLLRLAYVFFKSCFEIGVEMLFFRFRKIFCISRWKSSREFEAHICSAEWPWSDLADCFPWRLYCSAKQNSKSLCRFLLFRWTLFGLLKNFVLLETLIPKAHSKARVRRRLRRWQSRHRSLSSFQEIINLKGIWCCFLNDLLQTFGSAFACVALRKRLCLAAVSEAVGMLLLRVVFKLCL